MTLSHSVSVFSCFRVFVFSSLFFSFSLFVVSSSPKEFQWCLKFNGSVKAVSRKFEGCFKEVSSKFRKI